MKDITIIGNLGADAIIKSSSSGTEYLTCRVAVRGNDDTTMWFGVRCFDNFTIRHLSQWLKKGKTVVVVGDYSDREYLDKNNEKQISREINAYRISFVGSGNGTGSGEEKAAVAETAKTPVQKQELPKAGQNPQAAPQSSQDDEDLPF